jgi:hypothetical protein
MESVFIYNVIPVLLGAIGAILNLAGNSIMQSNINNIINRLPSPKGSAAFAVSTGAASKLMDIQWFHTFYYIAVVIAFCALAMHSSFDQHRMTLMAFLAIGFVYLTTDLQLYIVSARAESELPVGALSRVKYYTAGGPATSFAGCIVMVLAWFYMMIFTGGMPSMPSMPSFPSFSKK